MEEKNSIAKNTAFLYVRMLFTLAISLYTSRTILNVLGVEDFGIYNVVGGVVLLFSFLNNAMVSATQRFITYEQESNNLQRKKTVFTTAVRIHFFIAIIIFLLSETIGLWFLNAKMNISEGRLFAANCIFQTSILSFVTTVMTVPFTASVVAHEKMDIYAYLSVLDSILKLLIVFVLLIFNKDKLIAYGFLMLSITLIDFFIYYLYSRAKFEECRFVHDKDPELYKSMLSFSGWSFLGDFGFSAKDYGVNIVVNLFAGAAINASRGLAYQVTSMLKNFVASFQTAVRPQIIKRYSIGEIGSMMQLVTKASKISFFLMSIIIVPFLIRTRFILNLWLGQVPELAVEFLQLALIMGLINSMHGPIVVAIQATGNIKWFQIIIALLMFLDLPFSYILLKCGLPAFSVMYVGIATALIGFIVRALLLNHEIRFNVGHYLFNLIVKNAFIFGLLYFPINLFSLEIPDTIWGFLLISICSVIWSSGIILLLGLNNQERKFVLLKLKTILK